MVLSRLFAWLRLEDYTAAKEKATDDVVSRYSRRNTLAQNGDTIDRDELDQLSVTGDDALLRLEKLIVRQSW